MKGNVEYVTATSAAGRDAILEVMYYSFEDEIPDHLSDWAIARVVDGTPVSFIIINPGREMAFFDSSIPYAFINDVATREDRRNEGHFREIMNYAFDLVDDRGIAMVGLHGHSKLYRGRFGFDTFTYEQGVFVTPQQIERAFGKYDDERETRDFSILESKNVHDELLVISGIHADTAADCRHVLRQGADIARRRKKAEILFEYPFHPHREAWYPTYDSPDSEFCRMAAACGARIVLQGAFPEQGPVSHGDWLKLLQPRAFMESYLSSAAKAGRLPKGRIGIAVDDWEFSIANDGNNGLITPGRIDDSEIGLLRCSPTDFMRLVTGYYSVSELVCIADTEIDDDDLRFLDLLFPKRFRFSRNENWTYKKQGV